MTRSGVRRGRNRDLYHFTTASREAGEQRLDQARHDDVEPVGVRARLGAAVEQWLVAARCANVEVDLAVIFDVAVETTAAVAAETVPERIVPAVVERRVESVARIEEGVAIGTVVEPSVDDTDLTVVNPIAELNHH